MLILLPPSETKRDGGAEGSRLDLRELSFPGLDAPRRAAVDAVITMAQDPVQAAAHLRIGPKLAFEIERNRTLANTALLPAMDRYTGVLYDGLDAPSLDASARAYLAKHVVIASALFGLVGAGDPIPAYRLSHNSTLAAGPLKTLWRTAVTRELEAHPGLLLDLRSESYAALGPLPAGSTSAYLRVLSRGKDGTVRALNHFNKKGKGEFVRALALSAPNVDTVDDLLDWASSHGLELARGAVGEINLTL
ncbi:hypothetical protein B0I08_102285 [Glaciihabitans tibetensis]|uniref:Peroxide stress protein YaaA n=1 Tax=Glaciihabitans tibetensis TaxID=1266600 RepID=A0A2T0VHB5_9MICO|nr:peroxide stress protein YaaA [Glaciihabitans tibetensis]PRY69608.1 hypothetical protein B0I08_102285 [Glaciihabitans tibetensis]